ncbi:MAG TPA: hypothetical protein VM165_21550 [Planctomycetaceae bacterium]|nr:hypothetical protein [Planctomycetaceae bacterium]
MPTEDETQRYDVHLFAVVRLKVSDVAAANANPRAAIEAACTDPSVGQRLDRLTGPDWEFDEEFSHFLVDVVGDPEYARSEWFHSLTEPLLDPLRKLIAWDESGCPPDALAALLSDARDHLAQTA